MSASRSGPNRSGIPEDRFHDFKLNRSTVPFVWRRVGCGVFGEVFTPSLAVVDSKSFE